MILNGMFTHETRVSDTSLCLKLSLGVLVSTNLEGALRDMRYYLEETNSVQRVRESIELFEDKKSLMGKDVEIRTLTSDK